MMRAAGLISLALLCACGEGGDVAAPPKAPAPFSWSVDLDLAGDAAFTALNHDTSVTALAQGMITGRINRFDTALARDTVYFANWEHPEFKAQVPLSADGTFQLDAFDVLGDVDGSHTLFIVIKPAYLKYRPVPDTVRIRLDRS